MSASTYPYLFATLGEAARQLPHDIAPALEATLTATQAANAPGGPTLLDCLLACRGLSEYVDVQLQAA